MLVFLGIIIVLASILLGIIVLIQNPKGGGLAGTFGGFSNQVMGVRQTNDILEKGTWTLIIIIGVLCLASTYFMNRSQAQLQQKSIMENQNLNTTPVQNNTASPAAPFPNSPQQQQNTNGNGANNTPQQQQPKK